MNNSNGKITETIIRRREVLARTGLSKSTLYSFIKKGEFPAPLSLGGKAVCWAESEVDAWIAARVNAPRRLGPARCE